MPVSWFPKEQTEWVDKLIETNTEKNYFQLKIGTKPIQAHSACMHIKSMTHFQLNSQMVELGNMAKRY